MRIVYFMLICCLIVINIACNKNQVNHDIINVTYDNSCVTWSLSPWGYIPIYDYNKYKDISNDFIIEKLSNKESYILSHVLLTSRYGYIHSAPAMDPYMYNYYFIRKDDNTQHKYLVSLWKYWISYKENHYVSLPDMPTTGNIESPAPKQLHKSDSGNEGEKDGENEEH